MHNMHAQLLTFTKWRLHQDSCYTVLKEEKCFWSDNKYVFNETYIDKPRIVSLNKVLVSTIKLKQIGKLLTMYSAIVLIDLLYL